MDLENLKSELKKRLNYIDHDKENKYQNNIKIIEKKYISRSVDGARRSDPENEEYEKLKHDKIQDIRKILNDDESFNNLANKLDEIKAYKKIKEDELKRLDQPNKTIFQKIYTNTFGRFIKKNTDGDAESNREKITNEIQDLEKIISDIETLKPIYEKKTQEGGAKTKKTRRNRNSNKSRKNRRKSNCRY
jgi:hypothetical protein